MDRNDVIRKLTKELNTSAEALYSVLRKLIDEAYSDPSPSTVRYWDRIPRSGDRPTPDELIDFIAAESEREKYQ